MCVYGQDTNMGPRLTSQVAEGRVDDGQLGVPREGALESHVEASVEGCDVLPAAGPGHTHLLQEVVLAGDALADLHPSTSHCSGIPDP